MLTYLKSFLSFQTHVFRLQNNYSLKIRRKKKSPVLLCTEITAIYEWSQGTCGRNPGPGQKGRLNDP